MRPRQGTRVQIFGQVYHVNGGQDPDHILGVAALVDEKMSFIADNGVSTDSFRVAVLAALELADELLTAERADGELTDELTRLRAERDELKAENDRVRRSYEDLRRENERLAAAHEEEKAERVRLQARLERHKGRVSAESDRISALLKDIDEVTKPPKNPSLFATGD